MSNLRREFRLLAPAPSERRRRGSAFAVHQPDPPYCASSVAPAGRFTRATPRHAPDSVAPPRLHLKPGQDGTKELLAHCGNRLTSMRSPDDAQRGKRVHTVELLIAERDGEPQPPRSAADRLVALLVAFADITACDQV